VKKPFLLKIQGNFPANSQANLAANYLANFWLDQYLIVSRLLLVAAARGPSLGRDVVRAGGIA